MRINIEIYKYIYTRRITMSDEVKEDTSVDVRTHVRERYGKIASDFSPEKAASCCGPTTSKDTCCTPTATIDIDTVSKIYETPDAAELPDDVTNLSLGCGDPVTLASLQPGETVLDLGSGGGIDCFLAAKRVGETGHIIGIDMTTQMIEQARANKAKMGIKNVEFRLGEIEHLPVADEIVDVIISNCVINLSPDKPQVFREAYRALKPGGRLSVSDIVTDGALPNEIKNNLSAWAGCVAGALDVKDYIAAIEEAGFEDVELTPVYIDKETINEAAEQLDISIDEVVGSNNETLYRSIFSAKITAFKPRS
ncbi:arsenite methyltransferase [Chloroflexota bacterium]